MKTFPTYRIISVMFSTGRVTDTIPRASIQQLLAGLNHLITAGGKSTYEAVRLALLLAAPKRRAPNTRTALWTVARDILAEMNKLKLVTVGTLPRKLSDFERLRDTPCEMTPKGRELARLFHENTGQAYDWLLLRWLEDHSYFWSFILRLERGPLYIPDLTNLGQLGLDGTKSRFVSSMGENLITNCAARLETVGWSANALSQFKRGIEQRFSSQNDVLSTPSIDTKRLIDLIQDTIVIPSFLDAESLPFDTVTFSQILKCAQEFLCAAWTASYPRFAGRVVFSTCDFHLPVNEASSVYPTQVIHHGVTYATPYFAEAIRRAYSEVAGTSAGYANAYPIRALVCVELRIPLEVFARCLESLIATASEYGMTLYTELPFEPPPQGEHYIEVGRRRVGRLKIA